MIRDVYKLRRRGSAPREEPPCPPDDQDRLKVCCRTPACSRASPKRPGACWRLPGVLEEPDCAASHFLVLRGFLIEPIRAQVDELMVQPPRPAAATGGAKSNVVTCRLDDATLDAVDSLVEAGIRSSRSDAVALLIGAG